MATPRIRALVLHGFSMNGLMMREMMRDLCSQEGEPEVEWDFVDAGLPSSGAALPFVARRWPHEPCFEWWNADERPDGSVHYAGAWRNLELLVGPIGALEYDVLLGYSQGASMVAALLARAESEARERREARAQGIAQAQGDGREPGARRLPAAILFNSGYVPRDPTLMPFFHDPLTTPALHVSGGKRDFSLREQLSMLEAWDPASRVFIQHEQGHEPPTSAHSPDAVAAVRQWLTVTCRKRE